MLITIRSRVNKVKSGLTRLNNQPIGKSVLTIVLFLDLFILMSIFQGLDDHTRQLTTPYEYVPQNCRDIVIDEQWNENNRLTLTAKMVSRQRSHYGYLDENHRDQEVHPICLSISTLLHAIETDKTLSSNLSLLLKLRGQVVDVKSQLDRIKGAYDTTLLEDIADNSTKENPVSFKKEVSLLSNKLNALVKEEGGLVDELMHNRQLVEFFDVIDTSSTKNRDILLAELRDLNFWYPAKRLAMEMLFLLPLVIIFYLWNSKSIVANRPYQSLVSSHLLVVVFIPVIFKLMELIYDIVPQKLLKHIFVLLASLKLIAIWHYVMMGVAVLAAMALIYFMQKKIFSPEKIIQRRIIKGQCQHCGVHLPNGNDACPICGFMQFKLCGHCNMKTYIHGKYCRKCGACD
ncbi:hypothetical protein [Psychromonas sp. MME2]|uniref:hypothetical protein n=1 Tax=unclassified Psychromonas TaxID=2614957 RepID=UPI00339C1EC0